MLNSKKQQQRGGVSWSQHGIFAAYICEVWSGLTLVHALAPDAQDAGMAAEERQQPGVGTDILWEQRRSFLCFGW